MPSILRFLKLLRASSSLVVALARASIFKKIIGALNKRAKPITKLNLLKIIKITCDQHPQGHQVVAKFGMSSVVEELSRQDEAVLVRQVRQLVWATRLPARLITFYIQLAKEIVPALVRASNPVSASVSHHSIYLRHKIRAH
jgi:hypothetical protein